MARLRCKRGQGQYVLLDVLLGCLQCRKGLCQLILLEGDLTLIASELLYAALHDGKINRHRFKLCLQFCRWGGGYQPAERWSPRPDHLATVGLPSKRSTDTDESRNGKATNDANYSPSNRWPAARDLCVLETWGARRRAWSQPMNFIGRSAPGIEIGSVNIAFGIFIVKRYTFGGIHWSLAPATDAARGHHDLTERRLQSGLDENQTFGAIVYSCVSKMQHGDRRYFICIIVQRKGQLTD